jgi:hypothetical protein
MESIHLDLRFRKFNKFQEKEASNANASITFLKYEFNEYGSMEV